jgi:hypothetical protein
MGWLFANWDWLTAGVVGVGTHKWVFPYCVKKLRVAENWLESKL